MALLYERHFVYNAASKEGWANMVRRFDVGHFLEDNKTDEIVLEGDGWSRNGRGYAQSGSPNDKLKLKFRGTRVDVIVPPVRGGATVLIDGKKPSELNLFHGTRPKARTNISSITKEPAPNVPMAYHIGKNMQEETWTLAITHGNADEDKSKANTTHVRFKLSGSKTGPDGEGENECKFVSKSGRITILTSDWGTEVKPADPTKPAPAALEPLKTPFEMVWHIVPDSLDTIAPKNVWAKDRDYYSGMPYDYVTVADGLPCGIHELTLIPMEVAAPNNKFIISGIEAHRPPLARDTAECTSP